MFIILKGKKEIEINENVWKNYSSLIKNLINDYNKINEKLIVEEFEYITVLNIDKILNYKYNNKEKFSKVPKPMKENFIFDDYVSKYDANFFKYYDFEFNTNADNDLLQFIKCTNFFDINELFELSCAKMAELCREISAEKFKNIFLTNK
jgi:hypothetical protein